MLAMDTKQQITRQLNESGGIMSNHRYQYLYLPIMRTFAQLSPGQKVLLLGAKTTIVLSLVLFQLSASSAFGALF
jgi:hypothetical protein